MERIPLITITPTIKVQILHSLALQKTLIIPYLPQNSQKNQITFSYHNNMPITAMAKI
jgi:hypothetical protein